MTSDAIKEILAKHLAWLRRESTGARADLTGAVLKGAVLKGAVLTGAVLTRAVLRGAVLTRADLKGAVLMGADLTGAVLKDAVLKGAVLKGAVLRGADLTGADLTGAVLTDAVLKDAVLTGAVLTRADLTGAVLKDADLKDADLGQLIAARLLACPETGAFDGWKRCRDGVIVRLRIPDDARRSSATGRKCRAEFVDVLEVIGADMGLSQRAESPIEYRAGQRVTCDKWCEDRWQECAGGIHFFITRAEAEAFEL